MIRPLVCSSPAQAPAAIPARMAVSEAIHGEIPWEIMTAAVAAPVVKLPSTVRSGKSRMRNVM